MDYNPFLQGQGPAQLTQRPPGRWRWPAWQNCFPVYPMAPGGPVICYPRGWPHHEHWAKRRCHWRPDPGPCRGSYLRYYLDQDTGMCRSFNWGGCRGRVPFRTKQECEQACYT